MNLLTEREFLDLLGENEGHLLSPGRQITVEGNVHIDAKKLGLSSVRLEKLTFVHSLAIVNLVSETGCIDLVDCTVGESLAIQQNSCQRVNLIDSRMGQHVDFFEGKFCEAYFANLKVKGSLAIYGLELAHDMQINRVQFEKLELWRHSTAVKVPRVQTDDLTVAMQFRLAGIPVFMSTENVRKNMSQLTMA